MILVNARHIKTVPGRKTDVADCQWIAQLLQHGLLKASFIPPSPIRELRELTRARRKIIETKAAVINRIQKVREDANVKLASVASDGVGVSGRDMLQAIGNGETDAQRLASFARGRLNAKKEMLAEALEGKVSETHRFLLSHCLKQIEFYEEEIPEFDRRIEEKTRPFAAELSRLDSIPGVNHRAAECILAEIGADMSRFPDDRHLSSWAGMCPGNNESAGKQKSGRTRDGNKWLKVILTEAAWAASHTRQSYLSSLYHRLARRRGRKRALLAVGHAILVIAYHVLSSKTSYIELGEAYYEQIHSQRLKKYLVKRLESLGFSVDLRENLSA